MKRLNKEKLDVFCEIRKRRIFVGSLERKKESKGYVFSYDKKYLYDTKSIPLGVDIPLTKNKHKSLGKLFDSFQDRIPSRKNPAYPDYCKKMGISVEEKNPIILLGTIGKRGPSSFIFEPVYEEYSDVKQKIKKFRKKTGLSLQATALAFDLNYVTLQKIETGKSQDKKSERLIEIYLKCPFCLEEQIQSTSRYLHRDSIRTLMEYRDYLKKRA